MTLPVHPYRTSTPGRARHDRFPLEGVLFVTLLLATVALLLRGYAWSHRVEKCWRDQPDGARVAAPCDPP